MEAKNSVLILEFSLMLNSKILESQSLISGKWLDG